MTDAKQNIVLVDSVVYEKVPNGPEKVLDSKSEAVKLPVQKFESPNVSEVSMGKGVTLNLGNYQSARVDVSIKVPAYLEQLNEAAAFASKKCDEFLTKEILAIKSNKTKLVG